MTDSNNKHIDSLIDAINAINPLQRSFLNQSIDDLRSNEADSLNAYLDYYIGKGDSIDYLAECYNLISKDILREQIYFQKHRHYRYSTYDEVAHSVYLNAEYMEMYMHGLAITSFLWPNHREMHRFFVEAIPTDRQGKYLEIGPGHGMHILFAMQHTSYDYFEGVDISPKSVELTSGILNSGCFGKVGEHHLHCSDFLQQDPNHLIYDAIVMGEVLEHVEQPVKFLEKIRSLSDPSSFIYITTCINAPAIDHIYLFDTLESVESVVNAAGLTIKESLIVPYNQTSLEESLETRMPVNVAFTLAQ